MTLIYLNRDYGDKSYGYLQVNSIVFVKVSSTSTRWLCFDGNKVPECVVCASVLQVVLLLRGSQRLTPVFVD